jgi:hypothetical protein
MAYGPREQQTLALVLKGMSEKQMARAMGISPHTVHVYTRRLRALFGVRRTTEVIARVAEGRRRASWHPHLNPQPSGRLAVVQLSDPPPPSTPAPPRPGSTLGAWTPAP